MLSRLLKQNQVLINEKNIPTKQTETKTSAWLPYSYENERRTAGFEIETSKGAKTPGRVAFLVNNLTGAFPKTRRLTKSSGFRHVFKTDTRSVDSRFLVLARMNKLGFARLGMAISKRNVKTAVKRNRIKRLVRESFRRHQDELTGLDIVVVSQKRINMSKNHELTESLDSHWEKISKCKKY